MTENKPTTSERLELPQPGEVLREVLDELEITPYRLAQAIGKTPTQVSRMLTGEYRITPEMSILIGKALGQSPRYWYNLQCSYDMRLAERSTRQQVQPLVPKTARTLGA